MLIAQLATVDSFLAKHPAARKPLDRWVEVVAGNQWNNITEVRRMLPTADAIKGTELTCFNIGGNKYRLIVVISYPRQVVVLREMLTHDQYSKKYVR